MLNRDTFFKKREDPARRSVNVTPALGPLGQPAPDPVTKAATQAPRPETAQLPIERARSESGGSSNSGSRLIVGPAIKLKGVEITDCDTLVVEGTVEASMDSRVVQIAEQGVFTGTVSIDIAEIRGRFEGELTAREQLIIHATGRVSGKIRYGKIKIEEGAEISGDVARLETRTTARSTPSLLKSAGLAD
ncbi:MAG: polymer-forming cytoskeletal protein [Burkholderiales bacterium]